MEEEEMTEKGGFKKNKQPSKRELQLELQQQKALASQLGEHLGIMAPYSERMMKACFDVLGAAHRQQKAIGLAVSLGPDYVDQIRKTLELICDTVAEFAGDWKRTQEPGFVEADVSQLPKIEDVQLKCERCGWDGTVGTAVPDVDGDGSLGCPKCGKVAKEKKKPEKGDGEQAEADRGTVSE
jgi:hypothetical protein